VETSKTNSAVRTRERWHYRDRKIGSGEQVGEASLDHYDMLYVFSAWRTAGWWMKSNSAPPAPGRKSATLAADARDLHALPRPQMERQANTHEPLCIENRAALAG